MLTRVYATSAAAGFGTGVDFCGRMADVARWCEDAGLHGLLVFTDNVSPDPWQVTQFVIERTSRLVPLVAAQPAYMHPYAAARMISTISSLYERRVDVNLVAGAYWRHSYAVGNFLRHDERYDRLIEYGTIMARLLTSTEPVDHRDTYYEMVGAVLKPPLPPALQPSFFVAGSSPAADQAAHALSAVRLTYPLPLADYEGKPDALRDFGIRVGIIARDTHEQAWSTASRRYPTETKNPPSEFEAEWHQTLLHKSETPHHQEDPYWLHPFRISGEYCPFLVGSHAEVSDALAGYLKLGVSTLILSVPFNDEDLGHAMLAVRGASTKANGSRSDGC